MPYYLITEDELIKYKNDELVIEELVNPENQAAFTWSGEDIKIYLQEQLKKEDMLKDITIDKHINSIIQHLNNCQCSDCVTCIINEYIENLKRSN